MKRVVSTRSLQGKYKMTEVSALYCELIYNRQEKRATACFAILLQNELKSDAARFTYPRSNLFCNISGLLQVT